MSEEQRTRLEQAISRALQQDRYSRRSFLRKAGRGGLYAGGALSLPAILAACGIGPASSSAASGQATTTPVGGGEPSGDLIFANWELYIDPGPHQDPQKSPTLANFKKETGIDTTYTENILDNQSFFAQIQPDLEAGNPTGYDLIVMTDWMIGNMVRLGYLEQIDVGRDVPNFGANAFDKYKNPTYDANNLHSVPWQSGITGIGYNPALVDEEITSMAQLLDPAMIEKYSGQIGMFTDMRDCMSFALLYKGVNPKDATEADVEAARDVLLAQAPHVRKYYGNEYSDPFSNGTLAITMAWSGDVFQLNFDNPDLKFVVPNEGAMLWVDNMCIPKGAEHPNDALAMMNYVYDPDAAAQLAEWVNYICPVEPAQEVIRQHAAAAETKDDRDYLEAVADSPLVFPTQDMLDRLYSYKILDEAEERVWNEMFQEVTQG
ncbi:MAG: spermidine/putrescine ABC transporter substrate-binding protein [Chloroflexota bacterium]|jgi:spermidine/putrescine transport system substrate-binding protein